MFKTANNDSISRPNSRPKLPFPGNGKGKFKMPREGKGREIWGMYSRESRETGIPAHPCLTLIHHPHTQALIQHVHIGPKLKHYWKVNRRLLLVCCNSLCNTLTTAIVQRVILHITHKYHLPHEQTSKPSSDSTLVPLSHMSPPTDSPVDQTIKSEDVLAW